MIDGGSGAPGRTRPPRRLVEVAVVPGPLGVTAVADALSAALAGGPALAPVPVGPADSGYLTRVRAALRPDNAEAPLERHDVVAVVATSGSTGDPKGVLITEAAMRAAVAGFHAAFGGPAHWVVAMPVHAVGGLMVVARSVIGGTTLHVDPSVGGAASFDPIVFAGTVAAARAEVGSEPLFCSLVPTQLHRIVDAGEVGMMALRSLDAVISGAAATPATLLEPLRTLGIRVHTSYGMSETCAGCGYDGIPLPGVSFRTDAPDGRALGRITVTGAQVAAGYRLRPDPAFTGGRVVTGDLGTVSQDGHVTLVGRVDDVVVVGGTNVALPAVEEVLRAVPGVRDACVVALPDPEWGARLVGYVVAADDPGGPVDSALGAAVREALGRAAVPRRFVRTPASRGIPLLATGKPDRAALLAHAATLPPADGSDRPPEA
jgi:O-succinylbenzoic acid--CoA ligase